VHHLSALDTSFLRLETPAAHMHVGWLSHLELPAGAHRLDVARLATSIEARLHHAPRFRQRVIEAPLRLGDPTWADDPQFDLRHHVHVVPEEPVDRRRLRAITDEFLSRPLDRGRPLWSILAVPRVEHGGAAIVGKVHHAMVDGIAAVELGMLLFDFEPDPVAPASRPWHPQPIPPATARALDAIAHTAAGRARAATRVARLGKSPREGLHAAESGTKAALALAGEALRPPARSFLNREISSRRALLTQSMPMEHLEEVKRAHGVKLNDVVLALTAGALRQLAHVRREEPRDLRVMVPVSTRAGADGGAAGGNQITFCFMQLPLSVERPLDRLRRIRAETVELKRSGRIAGSEYLLRSLAQLPGPLKDRAARFAGSPRLHDLTVSNVPGPPVPLYAAGARVASTYPVIPISEGHALSIGALSYAGAMHFAAYVDPAALPASVELPTLLSMALVELMDASDLSPGTPRSERPRRRRARPRASHWVGASSPAGAR
jgi:WS/DGAT/MGAT family acyltransferase